MLLIPATPLREVYGELYRIRTGTSTSEQLDKFGQPLKGGEFGATGARYSSMGSLFFVICMNYSAIKGTVHHFIIRRINQLCMWQVDLAFFFFLNLRINY